MFAIEELVVAMKAFSHQHQMPAALLLPLLLFATVPSFPGRRETAHAGKLQPVTVSAFWPISRLLLISQNADHLRTVSTWIQAAFHLGNYSAHTVYMLLIVSTKYGLDSPSSPKQCIRNLYSYRNMCCMQRTRLLSAERPNIICACSLWHLVRVVPARSPVPIMPHAIIECASVLPRSGRSRHPSQTGHVGDYDAKCVA